MSDYTDELKRIKKIYGESFMRLCRDRFPTLLEEKGVLLDLLEKTFANNSRDLYKDIVLNGLESVFENIVYKAYDTAQEEQKQPVTKTPYELLDEAGYDLYECNTEAEIQNFRKYYAPGEVLCTFQGRRLERCYVFWAVKKDAEKIERKENPEREDEYGTSVMSIQFSRGKNSIVSIKNRYNHTVSNPDATYRNNLDRIIPGLRDSFTQLLAERGSFLSRINQDGTDIPNYVIAGDGKYYKYNLEVNGIYYCPGNIIIDNGNVIKLEPEKQELIDNFILDKQNKTLTLYDKTLEVEDDLVKQLSDIEKIEEINDKENGTKKIVIKRKSNDEPAELEIDSNNNIVGFTDKGVKKIGNGFLRFNNHLTKLDIPNVEEIGDYFLDINNRLRHFEAPNLKSVGFDFLNMNKVIEELELPNLEEVGGSFLFSNQSLKKFIAPKLRIVGPDFMMFNRALESLDLPSLERVDRRFLWDNINIKDVNFPNLTVVGDSFLRGAKFLEKLVLPKLIETGSGFLNDNQHLKSFEAPNLTRIAHRFLWDNRDLEELYLPNLTDIGEAFLQNNERLRMLYTPSIRTVNKRDISKLTADSGLTLHDIIFSERILNNLVINLEKNAKYRGN